MIPILNDLRTSIQKKMQDTSSGPPLDYWINQGKDLIEASWPWPFLRRRGTIVTVAPVTAGDADVTNGSKNVSSDNGSTSWAAGVVGRKFRIDGENAYYDIVTRSSATALILEQVYQGSTATDSAYSIFQNEYKLPPDMIAPKSLVAMDKPVKLTWVTLGLFDEKFPSPEDTGEPDYSVLLGRENDIYETGTISATVNTSIMTGSGTSWLSVEGLARGSKITVGENVYMIKSVDSDTQITVYQNIAATISSGTSYTIHLDNWIVLLHDIPDAVYNLPFRYQGHTPPMVNDQDLLICWPESMADLLELYGDIKASDFNHDYNRMDRSEKRFALRLLEAQRDHGKGALEQVTVLRSTDDLKLGRRALRFPSEYPLPWSR